MSYNPPMKEQILHYFRNLYYEDIQEYNKLSIGLDKLEKEARNKAIDDFLKEICKKYTEEEGGYRMKNESMYGIFYPGDNDLMVVCLSLDIAFDFVERHPELNEQNIRKLDDNFLNVEV